MIVLRSWIKPALGLAAATAVLGAILYVLQGTYSLGYGKAQAEGQATLEALHAQHAQVEAVLAQAALDDAKAAAQKLRVEQARNNQLASQLADQQRINRQTTDRLSGEIARVNDLYRDALDAQPKPLPACVFTLGWVRVYDQATGATGAAMPAAADTGGAAAQGTDAGAAEQLDSRLSQSAVLAHHVRYAEQCRNTAAQLDALIEAIQEKH